MRIGRAAASVASLPLNLGRNLLNSGSRLIRKVGNRANKTVRNVRRITLKGGKRTNRNRKNKNRSNKNRSNKNRSNKNRNRH